MEFTQEIIDSMQEAKDNQSKFVKWYIRLAKERSDMYSTYFNKSKRASKCLDFWKWDKYEKNKLLDLKIVNRCRDRFCTNCKRVALSRSLNKFAPIFQQMVNDDYYPLLYTFTIPNVKGDTLKTTIEQLLKAFKRLYDLLGKDGKKMLKNRKYKVWGAVRTLEITYNKITDTYHPHIHALFFIKSEDYDNYYFDKSIPGPYRNKSKSYIKFSPAEIDLMQLWKICYDDSSTNLLNTISDQWQDLYICNITEIDSFKGIKEVFKYSFKDAQITNYEVFKNIYDGILGRRLRSSLGIIYNMVSDLDCEEENRLKENNIEEYLIVDKEECPNEIIHNSIQTLSRYKEYKKISRFSQDKNIAEIIQKEG